MSLKAVFIAYYNSLRKGKSILNDPFYKATQELTQLETVKYPKRTAIINYLLTLVQGDNYLEIGVRDPKKNFTEILCKNKYSVDPGIEFENNPVDFKMDSDTFFKHLSQGDLSISSDIKFDIIFIDGLHRSFQVEKDILNSLDYISNDGFIIVHDCNPASEFHQRENYNYRNSPAGTFWNGTTWKAFYKFRHQHGLYSICFDTDWGVGVFSKKKHLQFNNIKTSLANPYFEYSIFNSNKKIHLNLTDFNAWKNEVKLTET